MAGYSANNGGLRSKYAAALVYALTVPPLLLASLWRVHSTRYKHFALTLLFTIFGTVCIIQAGDAYRHQLSVDVYYSTISLSHFLTELWQILTLQVTESGVRDVFKHVMGYLAGGILNMPYLFFPLVATVYGYFFAGSVLHVLRHLDLSKANYVILGLVFVFLFIKGLEGFYTVRTWTGMWILVYACLKYYETKKLRYMLLMFVPPFIHFGYFMMAIPAWIVLAFGSRALLYSGILIASTFTNFLPTQPVTEQIAQTDRGAASVGAYLREEERIALEEFEEARQQTNFYNAYRQSGLQRWAPTILVFTLIASGIYVRNMTPFQRRIFSVGVLTLAFSNLTWFLYAVHNRTLTIAMVFILAGFLMARLDPKTARHFRGLPPYYQWGLHLSLLLFAPLMMFQLSILLDRMSLFFLGMPFMVWLSPELNMSMKEVLRWLL